MIDASMPASVQGFKSAQMPELARSDERVDRQVAAFFQKNQEPDLASQIQGFLRLNGRDVTVSFDESTGHYVTRVFSEASGEVVRQVPSEEMLRVARNIHEMRGRLIHLFA
jgi:uncharacterized FlaG/YvyC family protein